MKKKTLLVIIFVVAMIFVFLPNAYNNVPDSNNSIQEPITINVYAPYEIMPMDKLIAESDLIVIGDVNFVYDGRWNTIDGKRPEVNEENKIAPDKIIFTDIDVKISKFIKGHEENVRVRSLGGDVDGDRMIADNLIPGMNTTYLLFLYLDSVGSTVDIVPGHYWITGTSYQGMYEVKGNKAVSATDERVLDELIAYIQKIVSENK